MPEPFLSSSLVLCVNQVYTTGYYMLDFELSFNKFVITTGNKEPCIRQYRTSEVKSASGESKLFHMDSFSPRMTFKSSTMKPDANFYLLKAARIIANNEYHTGHIRLNSLH